MRMLTNFQFIAGKRYDTAAAQVKICIMAKGWFRARVSEKAGGRLICPHTVKTIPGYTFSVDAGTVDVLCKTRQTR